MQRKHQKEGLVVITVALNLDDQAVDPWKTKVRKILESQNVTIPNFLLKETSEFVDKKFDQPGFPLTYVFNRQGKWKKFLAQPEEAEKWVERFLKAK